MIVVDANILVYSIINFPKTHLTKLLRSKDSDWRFPTLWEYEFGNAMVSMARQKEITPQEAYRAMEEARSLFIPGEMPVDGNVVFRLALERKLTFYDAQYLALAQTLGVPLVTEDTALRKSGAGMAVDMEEFLETLTKKGPQS